MTYELPAAPLSIGGVLDSGFRLYRDSLRRSWAISLIYALVIALIGIFSSLMATGVAGTASRDPRQVFALFSSPSFIGLILVGLLASMVFYGALVKAVSAWSQGNQTLSTGGALAIGVRRLPALLLGFVASALMIIGGLILLVIPGIYFMGKVPLWLAAMFMDDAGPLAAIGVSWRLTRGRWWRCATILTVALIIIYVLALATGLVAGLVGVLAHLTIVNRAIVSQLLSALSNFIVLPLFVSILVVMYHDCKLRNEGGDLAARLGALGDGLKGGYPPLNPR